MPSILRTIWPITLPTVWLNRAAGIVLTALIVAGALWFAWPRPIPVDIATVAKGPLRVTVDDEGKTRVRHIYTVSAPIAGKVLRIDNPNHHKNGLSLHVGDEVKANETVVAIMQPTIPGFIDVRSREELQAAVAAADAAITLAEAEIRRIEAALVFSRDDLQRAQALSRSGTITVKALEKARLDVATNEAALASAKAQLGVRRSERTAIAAKLLDPGSISAPSNSSCCIQIRAPVTGRVLRIAQTSEATVPAGAPLIEIGDPLDLEVIADLLSTDAVKIAPGSAVEIDGWGGAPLKGRVLRVDPAGFLKVSALGIEEQRVRTTIDFAEPPAAWSRLGHDYRVIVHVLTWSADDVLTVPVGALFRIGSDWAVYAVKDGRARATVVKIGHRNAQSAEVLSGLAVGDGVVLHPSDRVRNGSAVAQREIR
jgi:HlyD family secretion protein